MIFFIAFETALWNVWMDVSDEVPTFTVNVSVVTAVIVRILSLAGSVDLGYGWVEALLSVAQVNVIPPSLILIKFPIDNPCALAVFITRSPFAGL